MEWCCSRERFCASLGGWGRTRVRDGRGGKERLAGQEEE